MTVLFLETNSTCNKKGECLGDGLLTIKFPKDYKDCQNICQNTTNCVWFTYYEDGSSCDLFEECKEFSTNCSKCMSGEVSCPIDDPIDDYQCNLTGMCKVGLLIMLNANMYGG